MRMLRAGEDGRAAWIVDGGWVVEQKRQRRVSVKARRGVWNGAVKTGGFSLTGLAMRRRPTPLPVHPTTNLGGGGFSTNANGILDSPITNTAVPAWDMAIRPLNIAGEGSSHGSICVFELPVFLPEWRGAHVVKFTS